jgi:ATP-dependent DNA helicase RecQ
MQNIHSILNQYWGFHSFRPLQEDIINSVLSGKDTLALMPTGGGKSLCYQVPAMANEGMCLVISPLIALMKDQVENLRRKNITAYAIYSGMSRKEVMNILKTVTESNCKFLYVSPERLETNLFKEYLPGMFINLIAVDEAHCISQWGYDFRPPYLRIAELRKELPGIPVLALTASATKDVQEDICNKLSLEKENKGWTVFRQSFERPNLSYSIFKVHSKINKIIEILQKVPGTSIVYCKSRKRTKDISDLLNLQNIAADYYHAGLPQEERNKKQADWIHNKIRVIVCTNAFGMGIDKPDVRTVIHADIPDCLENYYQEAGRAGRDGKTSYAVLLYDEKDITELEGLTDQRFPSVKDIREVYQAVMNYLQIPTGTEAGRYYDFDFPDFLKKFQLNSHTALYSLKALEQDGWLSFNEQVFLPSSLHFIVGKNELYEFERTHPQSEPLIKSLLRAYEGIFDHNTFISELLLTSLLKRSPEEIKAQLMQLHRYGIVEYQPQKDKPQILLLRSRIKAEDLTIQITTYNLRKEKFQRRVKEMVHYIKEDVECRSRMIGTYFGDIAIKACGVCDNCLRKKAITISKEEFDLLHHRILNLVKYESLQGRDLLSKLGDVKKEKAWKVIEFLQAENKIEMDQQGRVRLK